MSGEDGVFGGLGVLAASDLTVRVVPDLIGVSDQIVVPLAVVTSQAVLGAGTVGWVINWVTLFVLAVYLTPSLFPQSYLEWASGPWARLAVAVGATATGLLVETALRSTFVGSPSPVPVDPSGAALGATVVGSAGLVGVAAVAGAVVNPTFPLGEPDGAYVALPEDTRRTGPVSLVVRGTIVVLTLGVVFAVAAQLYPLTEALVLGVAVYTVAVPADVRARDPVERLAVGAVAAWGRLRHVIALCYLLATLLIIAAISLDALGAFPVVTLLSDGVVGVAALFCLLVVPVVHVLKYADRAFRSFAVELDRERRDETAPDLVDSGRAPGFMLHAGALFGILDLLYVDGGLARAVSPLVWVVVAALTAVTVWASYGRAPYRVRMADHHAVPLAVALWVVAGGEFGNTDDGVTARLLVGEPVDVGVAVDAVTGAALVTVGVLFVYAPVGALAYGDDTASDSRGQEGGDSLGTALALWGVNSVVWTVCLGGLYVMAGTPGSFAAFDAWMDGLAEDPTVLGTLLLLAMGLSFLAAAAYTLVPLLSGRLVPRFEPVD